MRPASDSSYVVTDVDYHFDVVRLEKIDSIRWKQSNESDKVKIQGNWFETSLHAVQLRGGRQRQLRE